MRHLISFSECERLRCRCLGLVGLLLVSTTPASLIAQSQSPSVSGAALDFSRVGQSKMPVFSSLDGYVCFFLAIDKVTPAKRKVGIFNLPKPEWPLGGFVWIFVQFKWLVRIGIGSLIW